MILGTLRKRRGAEHGLKQAVKGFGILYAEWTWRRFNIKVANGLGQIIELMKVSLKLDWIGFLGALSG